MNPDQEQGAQEGAPRHARAWLWPIAAGAVGIVAYFALPSDGLAPLAVFTAVCSTALAAIVFAISRRRSPAPRVWWVLAAGVAAFLLATGWFFGYTAVTGDPISYPSVADVCYFAAYTLFATFLLLIVRASARTAKGDLLDALVITLSLAPIEWVFVTGKAVDATGASTAAAITSVAYGLADLVLFGLAVVVAMVVPKTASVRLLLVAFAVQVVTDVVYTSQSLEGTYSFANTVNGGWLAVLALLGAAALHPSSASRSGRSTRPRVVVRWHLTALRITAIMPLIAVIGAAETGDATDTAAIAVMWALLFVVVVQRLGGLMVDIEEYERVAVRSATLAASVESSAEAVVHATPTGEITYWNGAAEALFGAAASEAIGHDLGAVVPGSGDSTTGMADLVARAALGRPVIDTTIRHRAAGGSEMWISVTASPITDHGVERIACTIRDTTERRDLELQLHAKALTDPLTGLANRALFTDRLGLAASRRAVPGSATVLAMIDLDGFKAVNDSLGHAAGDDLLRHVSGSLAEVMRPSDTLARLGGDEFAVIVEDLPESRLPAIAHRLLRAIGRPLPLGDNREIHPRASIGLYRFGPGESGEVALQRADVAMYQAKAMGGGYAIFEESLLAQATQRHALELDLAAAVDRGEIGLRYQPVVELRTHRLVGFEAMAYWDHPGRGLLAPDEFMPVAEESGLIVGVGRFALMQACTQVAAWNRKREPDRQLSMGIRLSARQLRDAGLVDEVADHLATAGADPLSLMVGVTGTALAAGGSGAIAVLGRLKQLGVRVSLDEFGAGYASLTHLRTLPVDVLKLDRSLVEGIATADEEWSVAVAILGLAASLGKVTLATGIEAPAQLAHLRALDCQLGQGNLLAPPLPAAAIEEGFLGADPITLSPVPAGPPSDDGGQPAEQVGLEGEVRGPGKEVALAPREPEIAEHL